MAELKIGFFGFGYVASTFACDLEMIKAGEIDLTGIPLENKIPEHKVEDIKVICGFDVDKRKTGKTLSSVIHLYPELKDMKAFENIRIFKGINLDLIEDMPFEGEG
ncbi:MAG: hypothetical protein U9O53_03250 [archaeon]|nr:hypothetical protein [archaeon]